MSPVLSQVLTQYANWKIKPLKEELASYNKTDRILLTFDDYTDEKTLNEILEILAREKIVAIFFIIGEWAAKNPHLLELIKMHGHILGNHTKTHANLLKLDEITVRKEILGGLSSTLLRPPYGKYNRRTREIAANLGYKICYWSIDSDDWKGLTKDEITDRVLRNMHDGACILLHLNGPHTLEALPILAHQIKRLGYAFCQSKNDISL